MARLLLKLPNGKPGWLEMRLEPLPSEPEEGLIVHVAFAAGGDEAAFSMTGTTEGWQVSRVYFEVLGRSFVRAAEFAKARFPISYYEGATASPPQCTLHHNLEWLHVLMRGLVRRPGHLGLDCFILDPPSARFAHLGGV